MSKSLTLRISAVSDREQVQSLMSFGYHVHRHLDWQNPLDILGREYFCVVEDAVGKLQAALACSPYPPGYAWVNLFAVAPGESPQDHWDPMLHLVCSRAKIQMLAALPVNPWFTEFLMKQGFTHHQDIILLEWQGIAPKKPGQPSIGRIRKMTPADLENVLQVDNRSFEPIWQLSREGLTSALSDSVYSTVLEIDSQIIGYQITTNSHLGIHLARLAVLEEYRNQKLGYALVEDLICLFKSIGEDTITVNTQDDNLASQALYRHLGFYLTQETVPVYVKNFSE